jgi:fermentation-respiration switch protein FrsA (DUF1100 family)
MATVFPLAAVLKRLVSIMIVLSLSACTSLFFYPNKNRYYSPENLGLVHEDIVLDSADGTKLHAWLLKTQQTRKGAIYFLHGNAENISSHIASVYWLPEQGYDVFMLDYRGFGGSEGNPALPEIFEDIEAGMSWLSKKYPETENIFFFGQSIGGSTGVYWMVHSSLGQNRINKIILDAPFSSYPDMVEDVLRRSWITWLFAKPISWGFSSRYNPDRAAPGLPKNIPLLFFHSKDDPVVPFAQGEALYQTLPSTKKRIVTEGPHIATFNYPENRQALLDFLQK